MKQTAKIFLCYAKEDEPQVAQLYQKLKDVGFQPWMDKVDLVGGEEWRPAIQKAIREAHFFVACVSKHWIPMNLQARKRFFRREIQTALDVLPELAQGDIYIIPIRLEECAVPDSLSLFHWIDYFREDGWDRLLQSIYTGIDHFRIIKSVTLRSQSIVLSEPEAIQMIRKSDFFDAYTNEQGKGLQHQYEGIMYSGKIRMIIDYTTGLLWEQSGSYLGFVKHAEDNIQRLNKTGFADYNDWRLPTLEEVMSLCEPKRMNRGLYINPLFNSDQMSICTADSESEYKVWFVSFDDGCCRYIDVNDGSIIGRHSIYTRAVRSVAIDHLIF